MLWYALVRFGMLCYALVRFGTLSGTAVIRFHHFQMLSYAFICFQTLSYAFIHFHMLSYAFIRFQMLSYMLPYALVCFYMLLYAFTMLYKLLHALEAKVSQEEEEEARCSAVYRLFLRKPVKSPFSLATPWLHVDLDQTGNHIQTTPRTQNF